MKTWQIIALIIAYSALNKKRDPKPRTTTKGNPPAKVNTPTFKPVVVNQGNKNQDPFKGINQGSIKVSDILASNIGTL